MHLPSHSFPVSSRSIVSKFAGFIGKAALLVTGASLLIAGGNAQAVETIQLRYEGTDPTVPDQVTVSLSEIRTFVQSGELPQQVREFFNINRQDPAPIRQVLTEQIQVPSNLAENFVDTSVGRFVVSQLEKFVQGPDAVPNLQTALRQSIQSDRNISLLELVENYPTQAVTLNITELVQTYNDVSGFVGRVLPALEVAREFLQDIICDCPQPASANPAQSSLSATAQQTAACTVPQSVTSTASTPQSQTAAQIQPVQRP